VHSIVSIETKRAHRELKLSGRNWSAFNKGSFILGRGILKVYSRVDFVDVGGGSGK